MLLLLGSAFKNFLQFVFFALKCPKPFYHNSTPGLCFSVSFCSGGPAFFSIYFMSTKMHVVSLGHTKTHVFCQSANTTDVFITAQGLDMETACHEAVEEVRCS